MRKLLSIVSVILCWAPIQAQPPALLNTLTPEEIAQGKVLLFDGKTTTGWDFKGDAEVRDGALILGGKQRTWVRVDSDFSPNFELHLEYSTENNKPIQFEWHHRQFMGQGMGSLSLPRTSQKPGEWIEVIYRGREIPAGNGWVHTSKWRVVGDPAFTEQTLGGSASVPHSAFVAFDVPAGQKLYLRNVRVKTESVFTFPRLPVIIGGILAVLLLGAMAARAIVKRRAGPRPGGVARPISLLGCRLAKN